MIPEGIAPEDIVNVDYSQYDEATRLISPTVYKDGDSFCCLSGDDPESGAFGCGDTPDAAIRDWRQAYGGDA